MTGGEQADGPHQRAMAMDVGSQRTQGALTLYSHKFAKILGL
jgi:hypothetical protein